MTDGSGARDNPTIFGRLLRGEIPSDRVWEDEHCVAFRDIMPAAPTHVLVIPRSHLPTLQDAGEDHRTLLGHMLWVVTRVAEKLGVAGDGYRVVINVGEGGGQTVFHLHMHLLSGRGFAWPPG
jgi:histidine triad (HIT) family protein